MITKYQLLEVMSHNTTFIEYSDGQKWSTIRTMPIPYSLSHQLISLSVFYFNRYYTICYIHYCNGIATKSELPSTDSSVPAWYASQVDALVSWLTDSSISDRSLFVNGRVHTFCRYCHRLLTSYKSMVRGYGRECMNEIKRR